MAMNKRRSSAAQEHADELIQKMAQDMNADSQLANEVADQLERVDLASQEAFQAHGSKP